MASDPVRRTAPVTSAATGTGTDVVPLDGRVFEPDEIDALFRDLPPATADDQTRTWDGRVLDTEDKVLEFLADVAAARAEGRGPEA